MEAYVLGKNSGASRAGKKCRLLQSGPIQEQVVAYVLKLLSGFYLLTPSCSEVEEEKLEFDNLKCNKLLQTILESDREPLLQSATSHVQSVFPKREIFYHVKDTVRLLGIVTSSPLLASRLGVGGATAGWKIDEFKFTAQMRAVSTIALHRRSNLASFLENDGSEVVDGLMQVLWGILDIEKPDTQTINHIVIPSVELIYSYAECLASHGNDVGQHFVAPAVALLKKPLFAPYEAIQTSSSLAISSRLLQVPFPRQTMLATDDMSEHVVSTPAPSPRSDWPVFSPTLIFLQTACELLIGTSLPAVPATDLHICLATFLSIIFLLEFPSSFHLHEQQHIYLDKVWISNQQVRLGLDLFC